MRKGTAQPERGGDTGGAEREQRKRGAVAREADLPGVILRIGVEWTVCAPVAGRGVPEIVGLLRIARFMRVPKGAAHEIVVEQAGPEFELADANGVRGQEERRSEVASDRCQPPWAKPGKRVMPPSM